MLNSTSSMPRSLLACGLLVACSTPVDAPGGPALRIEVHDGASSVAWNQDVFDRTPRSSAGKNSDGDPRDTWSVRALVGGTFGATARVATVIGDTRKTITLAEWSDESRTPIFHRTRRGHLNFCWADASGKWGDTQVKNVVGVELAR
jgi:hypothetical protein